MQKLIIIGNGSYARMMNRYIDMTEFGETVAFAVDQIYIQEQQIDGLPVISLEALAGDYSQDEVLLIMGIGYRKMSNIRRQVYETCKSFGYQFANYIHPTAIIEKNVALGEGNNILEGVIIEESVSLGNANLLYGGSLIAHETVVGDFNTFSVKAVVAGCTVIRHHCFIGAAATIKDHIVLEDYVFIGASAYASKSMEKYSVLVPSESRILADKKSIDLL